MAHVVSDWDGTEGNVEGRRSVQLGSEAARKLVLVLAPLLSALSYTVALPPHGECRRLRGPDSVTQSGRLLETGRKKRKYRH
jgi:hypothetical protein